MSGIHVAKGAEAGGGGRFQPECGGWHGLLWENFHTQKFMKEKSSKIKRRQRIEGLEGHRKGFKGLKFIF